MDFVPNQSFNIIYLLIFWQNKFSKKFFYPYLCPKGHTITPKLNFCPKCCQKCSIKFNLIISNVWCQIVLVPNCPVPNCPGAKLSRCHIVRVPNCPFLLSWCQIVRFYYLGAKLSVFIILVPNCPLYYLGAKLSYNLYLYTFSLCNVAFVMDVAHAFPMTPNLAKNREDMRHPQRYIYL